VIHGPLVAVLGRERATTVPWISGAGGLAGSGHEAAAMTSRWLAETGGERGRSYDAAFDELARTGADVHGEAAYVCGLLAPGGRVLDAGCGTGRVGIELARRGYDVTGVDSDGSMLAVAVERAPELTWRLEDLTDLDDDAAYHLVVAAGNVMIFLAPGSGPAVVSRLARALRPGGLLVSGWRTDELAVAEYDGWAGAAGLVPVVRHAGWDATPLTPDADWCVAVDRRVPGAVDRRVPGAVDRRVPGAVDRSV
jgi:SAM-dependent methyltransferase